MGVEVNGEIRELLAGPAGGVRILRRNGSGIEWEAIAHTGEVFTGRYFASQPSGSCIEEIDLPGRIPDTDTLNQRYKWILGPDFSDSLVRDQRTLRLMEHVAVSSNGSERWVTRVRRLVPYPSGLFTNLPT